MSGAVDLRELDLDSAPEHELRAAHAIAAPALWHHVAGDDPFPFEEWYAEEAKRQALVDSRYLVAEEAREIVGCGFVELAREGNRHLAWIEVAVVAAHRRRGIGRALAAGLIDIGDADGRTSVGAGADEGSAGEAFLAGLGLTHRQTVHLNRLQVADLDRGLLEGWVDRAPERAGGDHLLAWDGPTPDEHAEAFAACTEVMNTAPLGDLEIEHERMSCGLGRWLKAAMLLRLLDEKPAVPRVDTGNAGSNAPMLSINHALGFRPAKVSGNWQGDLDTVRKHLSERP